LRTYGSTPGGVLHKKPHNGVPIDCRTGLNDLPTLAQLAEPGKSAYTAYFAQKGIWRQDSALQQPKHLPWRPNVSRRCQNTSHQGQTLPFLVKTLPIRAKTLPFSSQNTSHLGQDTSHRRQNTSHPVPKHFPSGPERFPSWAKRFPSAPKHFPSGPKRFPRTPSVSLQRPKLNPQQTGDPTAQEQPLRGPPRRLVPAQTGCDTTRRRICRAPATPRARPARRCCRRA
jgi:hypothetical protein